MKKNRTMRAASLMLVLTLITCCFVGGTFSKYTSSATGDDSARVAKWSFIVGETDIAKEDTITIDLFNTVYEEDAKTEETHVTKGNEEVIIAPGTGGKFDIEVKNDSEVDATYSLSLTATTGDIPLEYSTDGENYETAIGDLNKTDVSLTKNGGEATVTATITATQVD